MVVILAGPSPLHEGLLLLQVAEPHPHPGDLQLQLPVLSPQGGVVVPRGHGGAGGAAAADHSLREEEPLGGAAAGDGGSEAEMLGVEDADGHLDRQAVVLGGVVGRVLRELLAVDELAELVGFELRQGRMRLDEGRKEDGRIRPEEKRSEQKPMFSDD